MFEGKFYSRGHTDHQHRIVRLICIELYAAMTSEHITSIGNLTNK